MGEIDIEQVNSYKYLGLETQENLVWKLFKQRLLEKAGRSMSAAWGMGVRGGQISAKGGVGIWKAIVRPVLE